MRAWRAQRAIARVAAVDAVLADYATEFWGRPVRRRDGNEPDGHVTWTIEGDVVAEFHPGLPGPSRLIVHEIALVRPLRKRVRSRHVEISYEPGT